MTDILQEIVAWKRVEVEQMRRQMPDRELHRLVEQAIDRQPSLPSMREALSRSATGIIAEYKRRSPSKGWIVPPEGDTAGRTPGSVPLAYQQNGAAALSILTDERYFGGSDQYIEEAWRSGVTIPILYKNFVISEYQLFRARLCGASAVLLIAADLTLKECRDLLRMAHELGMEVLLEMHSEAELAYADLEPDLYGVNNRNLGSFVTDVENSFRMASRLPADGIKVSESGLNSAATVARLRQAGYRGFLIGEYFMRHDKPGEALASFVQDIVSVCSEKHSTSDVYGN